MKTRFIAAVVAAARKPQSILPFQRGPRRAAFVAKRQVAVIVRRSA